MEILQSLHDAMMDIVPENDEWEFDDGVVLTLNSQPRASLNKPNARIKIDFPENFFFRGSKPYYIVVAVTAWGSWLYVTSPQRFNRKQYSDSIIRYLKDVATELMSLQAA